jgi:hypothetical protein
VLVATTVPVMAMWRSLLHAFTSVPPQMSGTAVSTDGARDGNPAPGGLQLLLRIASTHPEVLRLVICRMPEGGAARLRRVNRALRLAVNSTVTTVACTLSSGLPHTDLGTAFPNANRLRVVLLPDADPHPADVPAAAAPVDNAAADGDAAANDGGAAALVAGFVEGLGHSSPRLLSQISALEIFLNTELSPFSAMAGCFAELVSRYARHVRLPAASLCCLPRPLYSPAKCSASASNLPGCSTLRLCFGVPFLRPGAQQASRHTPCTPAHQHRSWRAAGLWTCRSPRRRHLGPPSILIGSLSVACVPLHVPSVHACRLHATFVHTLVLSTPHPVQCLRVGCRCASLESLQVNANHYPRVHLDLDANNDKGRPFKRPSHSMARFRGRGSTPAERCAHLQHQLAAMAGCPTFLAPAWWPACASLEALSVLLLSTAAPPAELVAHLDAALHTTSLRHLHIISALPAPHEAGADVLDLHRVSDLSRLSGLHLRNLLGPLPAPALHAAGCLQDLVAVEVGMVELTPDMCR